MILAATETGTGTPLVILHGMFGQGRNWMQVSKLLAERARVVAMDLRNHGASPWGEPMDYAAMAEDVAETMEQLGIAQAPVVGHSMGGKVAMMLALTRPEAVSALVVADIAPAEYPAANLAYVKAMQAIDLTARSRRAEVEEALAATIPDRMIRAFLLQSLVVGEGGLSWRINLDAMERWMTALSKFPAPAGRHYEGPCLFVAGGRSDYIRPEHQPVIRQLFPAARQVTLKDAAHWVHADQPEAFAQTLAVFLGL